MSGKGLMQKSDVLATDLSEDKSSSCSSKSSSIITQNNKNMTTQTNKGMSAIMPNPTIMDILSLGLKESPHLYTHQLLLLLEALANHLQIHSGDDVEGKDDQREYHALSIRHTMNGCLLSANAVLRNFMIKHPVMFINGRDPFKSHFRDTFDPNLEELLKNQEYVELFKKDIVAYRQWIAYGNKYSQSSKCEIKIKRKSTHKDAHSDPYIYLIQQHGLGVNCREETYDQYYQLLLKKDSQTIPILESLFYRDPMGEAKFHKKKLQQILKECELPSEWDSNKFLSFLMLCSSSLLNEVENCDFDNTLDRIEQVMDMQEDDDDEVSNEDEENSDDETTDHYSQHNGRLLYTDEENGKQTNYELEELPQGCLDLIQALQDHIVTRHESYCFATSIGEYVSQQDTFSKVTFRRVEKPEELLTVVVKGTFVSGYGDSSIDFSISTTNEHDETNHITTLEMRYSNENALFEEDCSKSKFMERLIGHRMASQFSSIAFVFCLLLVMDQSHHFMLCDCSERTTADDGHSEIDLWYNFKERFPELDELFSND
ncbi:hypothetical protein FDP41_006162 [Naegleria fowleri]|uniref:Uncharacterized protein n=1 Tax=Naegleria fowleri TaxID=5763 RepID=A0A6A5BKK2_NAEFO|nr:uncharacterized protein FDP41_006162 [Naegleria fowleri]KAF0974688.1 hypothetical protein FDP41_006162 [Naegleria fowleri]